MEMVNRDLIPRRLVSPSISQNNPKILHVSMGMLGDQWRIAATSIFDEIQRWKYYGDLINVSNRQKLNAFVDLGVVIKVSERMKDGTTIIWIKKAAVTKIQP